MLLFFIVYVVVLAALLAVIALVGSFTKLGVPLALVVTLVGGALLILFGFRRGQSKLHQLLRLYFQRLEQMHLDFAARRQLDRQVADLATFLHTDLHFGAVALLSRKKQGFTITDTQGVSRERMKQLCFGHRDELVRTMESRRTMISLAKVYAGNSVESPFGDLPFEEALPILAAGKCSHFILVSGAANRPMRLLRPFMLALADQIGVYHQLDDLLNKHNQQVAKLRKELDSAIRERERRKVPPAFDARSMINAQDRLMRIHGRDQLYASLLQLFEEQFKIDFAYILLRNKENGDYEVKYSHNLHKGLATKLGVPAESSFVTEIRQCSGCARMDQLTGVVKDAGAIQNLRTAGVRAIGVLTDVDGAESLMAVGRARQDFSDEELEAAYSYCRLFNLVLDNQVHFEKIEQMSYTDPMTGLYNYRYFYKRLQEEILRAKRFSRHLALVIFDIDEFKVFNDTYGHQSGDYLLEQLGGLLAKSVRSIDVVSRYGGEEFCVIMPDTSADDCSYFMDRMRVTVLNHEFLDRFTSDQHRITVSLGGAIYPNDAQRIDRLIYCADISLLQAKSAGRNKAFMFTEKLLISRSELYDKKTTD
jgi:diguanylate cyclase (GGDEF)-like protein